MKSRLARNVVANVAQMLLGAALLFVLYRYINTTLGVQQLGIWAVVLSTVSVSRLAEFGLSAGVTRFVARERTRDDVASAVKIVDTSFLSLLIFVGGVLPILDWSIRLVLPSFLHEQDLAMALAILPYALISLWLTVASTVFLGGLAGCERMDLQAALLVCGQAFLLALAVILVPSYGLTGLALAQVGQSLFVLIGGRLLLCRVLPMLPTIPRSWTRAAFREIVVYGGNVQLASMAQLVFETTTKLAMARFGGTTSVGFLEMANQLVTKVRAVIVAANQAVVPHVAALAERRPEELRQFTRANLRVLTFFALPVFALLFSWVDGLSWILTGKYEPQFVWLTWTIGLAWFFNTLGTPAYFMNLGVGRLKWNTYAHVCMAVANLALGWRLGVSYGAAGIAAAYGISLMLGTALLLITFKTPDLGGQTQQQKFHPHLVNENGLLISTCSIICVLAWFNRSQVDEVFSLRTAVRFGLPPLALFAVMWVHPLRREMFSFTGPP